MTYYEELKMLIAKYTGNEKELLWDTAINNDLKIEGDDAVDFLLEFAEKFQVDMRTFPFEDYFYNEGELSYFWLLKLLGLRRAKKPLYISRLIQAIEERKL